ncbi:CYTH domain-containing protein [Campylobacter estrildidarum]|uniref:CYTH domain-containing protein n=1 Tax=Campylobacter estrildidarum TaxID=2510189 RepID=A0A4U7BQY3_9BACT|nr:hypothetical protein [Campylobacter estrildidarum]TKX31266.1 hypothetical protein CQA69_03220 [Campylobacter estrildidarum]
MVHEIQKNFLLSDATLLMNFQKDGILFKSSEFEIFYTKITCSKSIKFKNIDGSFYKVIRINDEILEQNYEEKISKKEFIKARKNRIGKSIKKKRYEFKFCSLKSFIDVYSKPEICILKVFFPTLEEARRFSLPNEFKIQKEFDYILDSKFMILYGCDFFKFDVEKYFKKIEKNQDIILKFPNLINAFKGYRIFLFYLFKKLKFYWNLALDKKQKEYFCEFISYANKIHVILVAASGVFNQNLSKDLIFRFKDLIEKFSHFYKQDTYEDLLLFLSGEFIQSLFSDFDFFIKENSFYEGEKKDKLFKQAIAIEFRKKLIFFKKNLLKDFEKSFLELGIFLEYFCDFFDIKSLNKLYKKYFILKSKKEILSKIGNKKEKFDKLISRSSKELKIYKGC